MSVRNLSALIMTIELPLFVVTYLLYSQNPEGCHTYYSKWAICNTFISLFSTINISLEQRESLTKTKLLAMFILETYHKKSCDTFKKACIEFYDLPLKEANTQFDSQNKLIRKNTFFSHQQAKNLEIHGFKAIIHQKHHEALTPVFEPINNLNIDFEQKNSSQDDYLELQCDIYCIAFVKFRCNDPISHRELVLKSIVAFLLQMLLIAFVWYESNTTGQIFMGDPILNTCRIVCAYLLHLIIVPEVRCALGLMSYSKQHSVKFQGSKMTYPFMISFMKFMGGFATEIVNVFIIVQSKNVGDVIKDFIAFQIIAEIDDIMGRTLNEEKFNLAQETDSEYVKMKKPKHLSLGE